MKDEKCRRHERRRQNRAQKAAKPAENHDFFSWSSWCLSSLLCPQANRKTLYDPLSLPLWADTKGILFVSMRRRVALTHLSDSDMTEVASGELFIDDRDMTTATGYSSSHRWGTPRPMEWHRMSK